MAINEPSLNGENDDDRNGNRIHGNAGVKRPQYTNQDDALILTRLTAAKAAGMDMDAAIMSVADEMGRPESGIKSRWARLNRELKKSGTDDQAMALIHKLKNSRGDRAELVRERDAYKMKWEKEAHEHKKTLKELTVLKQKYEALVAELAAAALELEE